MKRSVAVVVLGSVLFLMMTGVALAQPPAATVPTGTTQQSFEPDAAPAAGAGLRALIVVAHPDDEFCFAATIYEITHNLGGKVDQLVVTNGEGGYRFSLLAESYYGIALTNEAVGRAELPEIRKRELLEAGHILGVTNHFFLDELDKRYTQDVDEVLGEHWNARAVLGEVKRRINSGNYDFVFTLFPSPQTHGAHKAATLTALTAAQQMAGRRPVVLGCQLAHSGNESQPSWIGFKSPLHPFSVLPEVYSTDRTVKFGFRNALDYQTIVNWVIAAHKSQGQFQNAVNRADREEFAILESGASDETERTSTLFKALAARAAHPREFVKKP